MDINSYFKKAFHNSAWMIAAKIINIIIGFFVSVCVTRHLGVEQKGILSNTIAISTFWGFISSSGVLDITIAKFSKERNHSGRIAASSMRIMFFGGIISYILSILSSIVLCPSVSMQMYVAIYSATYLFQYLSVYEYWFYSNSNSKKYAFIQSIIHIVFLLIKILGVLFNTAVLFYIIVASAETICVYYSAKYCYKKVDCAFIGDFKYDKDTMLDLIKLIFPLLIIGFATTVYMKVDQIMVGKMMGNIELGYYSVAVNIAEYWYFIPAAFYSSFLPAITDAYYDKEMFFYRLQQFADIMMALGYFAVFSVMLFGKLGLTLLYGEEFIHSASILVIYIWSGIFTCLSYSGQAYYIIHKDTKTIMWINVVGAILNFLLNIYFIRLLGSIGAAIATLIEYAIIAFGQMIVLRYKYGDLYRVQIKSFFPFYRVYSYIKSLETEKLKK